MMSGMATRVLREGNGAQAELLAKDLRSRDQGDAIKHQMENGDIFDAFKQIQGRTGQSREPTKETHLQLNHSCSSLSLEELAQITMLRLNYNRAPSTRSPAILHLASPFLLKEERTGAL